MVANPRAQKEISRRRFLGWVWGASLVGLFGQAGMALLQFFKPRVASGSFGADVVAGVP
ncbi:MAG TPA: hypothetical protein VJ754_02380 [Anaerolineae bacterium]|nr:hypothetical protein [Anaerolineae bacterium]